ncbi:hypothetical protein DITRI_Ditri11bG0050400 [Diplodiscus trichospermus]
MKTARPLQIPVRVQPLNGKRNLVDSDDSNSINDDVDEGDDVLSARKSFLRLMESTSPGGSSTGGSATSNDGSSLSGSELPESKDALRKSISEGQKRYPEINFRRAFQGCKEISEVVFGTSVLNSEFLAVTAGTHLNQSSEAFQLDLFKQFEYRNQSPPKNEWEENPPQDKNHTSNRTDSLLRNLLDVVEEVKIAWLEIRNLTLTSFRSPSGKQLDLQLAFTYFEDCVKMMMTLDITCLNW